MEKVSFRFFYYSGRFLQLFSIKHEKESWLGRVNPNKIAELQNGKTKKEWYHFLRGGIVNIRHYFGVLFNDPFQRTVEGGLNELQKKFFTVASSSALYLSDLDHFSRFLRVIEFL